MLENLMHAKSLHTTAECKMATNKFGTFDVDYEASLPFGVIGIPEPKLYYIIKHFSEKMPSCSLMQSHGCDPLIFITYNHNSVFPIINEADILSACMLMGAKQEDVDIFFLISSLKKLLNKHTMLTVNAKAPLFIDRVSKNGMQYVMQSNYSTQHTILI